MLKRVQARMGGGKRPPGVPPPNDGVLGVAWSGCAVIGVEWILDEKMVQLFRGGFRPPIDGCAVRIDCK